jgi:hypothetical protein
VTAPGEQPQLLQVVIAALRDMHACRDDRPGPTLYTGEELAVQAQLLIGSLYGRGWTLRELVDVDQLRAQGYVVGVVGENEDGTA